MLRKIDEEYTTWDLTINTLLNMRVGHMIQNLLYLKVKITLSGGSNEKVNFKTGQARTVAKPLIME